MQGIPSGFALTALGNYLVMQGLFSNTLGIWLAVAAAMLVVAVYLFGTKGNAGVAAMTAAGSI